MNPYGESKGVASEKTKARKAERQRGQMIKPEIQVVEGKIKFKPFKK